MSGIYLDASALLKMLIPEPCSVALVARADSAGTVATSVLARVEVARALARAGVPDITDQILDRCTVIDLHEEIVRRAATLPPATLRALDAIHVATALALGPDVDAFVTYDRRQATAAAAAGLTVESPGLEEIPASSSGE